MTTPDTVDMTRRLAERLWRRDLASALDVGPQPGPDHIEEAEAIVEDLTREVLDDVFDALTRKSYVTWAATVTPDKALFTAPVDLCREMLALRVGRPHV